MKRDALKAEISNLIDETIPENKELTEDDVADIEGALQDLGEIALAGESEEDE